MALIQSVSNAALAFESGNLVFPSDVDSMVRSKHSITFFINQQEKAKLKFPTGATGAEVSGRNGQGTTISVERPPTKTLKGSITLYMPNQVSVSHNAKYGEAEIGMVAAAAMSALKAYQQGGGIDTNGILETIRSEGTRAAANVLETVGVTGAKAVAEISAGTVTNNRTEMLFEGIDRRSFAFTFRMLPKSQAEAMTVKNIVTMFRLHSMPEFADSVGGRTLVVPSTFDIEYSPGEHLHKISTCVLESVDVKYGGDRTQFFHDNHPVETELQLKFKELEIITKERVAQGF